MQRVFVYGTLLTGMANHYLIAPYAKKITPAQARGLLYALPYGYPAMIAGNGTVYGEVVELTGGEEAWRVLDDLEDYRGPGCPDNLYERVVQKVCLPGGQLISAYVYLWAKPDELPRIGRLLVHGNWRRHVRGS
ncbi:MAG: gamma-glutamylcyclotransferase family protein [Bacillota bacterium]